SIVGIALFAACSYLELPPWCWFLPAVALLGYLLFPQNGGAGIVAWGLRVVLLLVVLGAVSVRSSLIQESGGEQYWSPYYRIDYEPNKHVINVNLIGHQQMVSRDDPFPAYALPHLL